MANALIPLWNLYTYSMASFNANLSRIPVLMGNHGLWGASTFSSGVDTAATLAHSSSFYREKLSNGYFLDMTGSNLQYDSTTDSGYYWPRTGGITKIELKDGSFNTIYSLTDLVMSVELLIATYDAAPDESWQHLLSSMMNGNDSVIGSAFSDSLYGYDGNDIFIPASGNDTVNGGMGTDTVLYGASRSNYTITPTVTGARVVAKAGTDGSDTVTNVERLKFADGAVALDISGNAGQAYRLYQAAFDRKPDAGGLGTWINFLDQGHTLQEASALFQQSTEFVTKYGTNVDNDHFVRLLYQNVLHRTPDVGGYLTWMDVLNLGQQTKAEVLIGFSESPENKAALIGVQSQGMEFTPVA